MNTHLYYLLKTVDYRLKEEPLFYVSLDIERAIGLERSLKNMKFICFEDDDLVNYLQDLGIDILAFRKVAKEDIYRSSAKLLESRKVIDFIKEKTKDKHKFYFQTFKISANFEEIVKEKFPKAIILNTSSKLNKLFENKLSQYEILNKAGIPFAKTIISTLEDISYLKLKFKLGRHFVVQFNRGHTGSGTFFIENKEDFQKLQNLFPKRIARISKFIQAHTYTLNAVVAKKETFIGGLSYQITGVPELTEKKGGTVGNDFYFREGINNEVVSDIIKLVEKIGDVLRTNGYLGMFGLDFMVDNKKIYVIEINARQPASIPFYTKLQLKQDEIPLSLLHITEFLDIKNSIDVEEYNRKNLQPIKASQIFLRNTSSDPFIVKAKVKSGVYRLRSGDSAFEIINNHRYLKDDVIFLDEEKDKPLIFEYPGISIDDLKDGGMIILTKPQNSRLNSQEELARIQVLQNVVDKKGKLYNWVVESLLAIKFYMK